MILMTNPIGILGSTPTLARAKVLFSDGMVTKGDHIEL